MPAFVNKRVGSFNGTKELDARCSCEWALKKLINRLRISETSTRFSPNYSDLFKYLKDAKRPSRKVVPISKSTIDQSDIKDLFQNLGYFELTEW